MTNGERSRYPIRVNVVARRSRRCQACNATRQQRRRREENAFHVTTRAFRKGDGGNKRRGNFGNVATGRNCRQRETWVRGRRRHDSGHSHNAPRRRLLNASTTRGPTSRRASCRRRPRSARQGCRQDVTNVRPTSLYRMISGRAIGKGLKCLMNGRYCRSRRGGLVHPRACTVTFAIRFLLVKGFQRACTRGDRHDRRSGRSRCNVQRNRVATYSLIFIERGRRANRGQYGSASRPIR